MITAYVNQSILNFISVKIKICENSAQICKMKFYIVCFLAFVASVSTQAQQTAQKGMAESSVDMMAQLTNAGFDGVKNMAKTADGMGTGFMSMIPGFGGNAGNAASANQIAELLNPLNFLARLTGGANGANGASTNPLGAVMNGLPNPLTGFTSAFNGANGAGANPIGAAMSGIPNAFNAGASSLMNGLNGPGAVPQAAFPNFAATAPAAPAAQVAPAAPAAQAAPAAPVARK